MFDTRCKRALRRPITLRYAYTADDLALGRHETFDEVCVEGAPDHDDVEHAIGVLENAIAEEEKDGYPWHWHGSADWYGRVKCLLIPSLAEPRVGATFTVVCRAGWMQFSVRRGASDGNDGLVLAAVYCPLVPPSRE